MYGILQSYSYTDIAQLCTGMGVLVYLVLRPDVQCVVPVLGSLCRLILEVMHEGWHLCSSVLAVLFPDLWSVNQPRDDNIFTYFDQ